MVYLIEIEQLYKFKTQWILDKVLYLVISTALYPISTGFDILVLDGVFN